MYLKDFSETEKNAFYALARNVISSDGMTQDDECVLLSECLNEMEMSEHQICEITMEGALQTIADSTESIKRKIYFELLRIALCDATYARTEKRILKLIAEALGISKQESEEFTACINALTTIHQKIDYLLRE